MISGKNTRKLCFIFVVGGGGGGGGGVESRLVDVGGGSLQKGPFMATKWCDFSRVRPKVYISLAQ